MSKTNKNYLEKITAEFSETSPTNYLTPETSDENALGTLANNFYANNFARNNFYGKDSSGTGLNTNKPEEFVGMRFFMPPIIAVGSAADEGFLDLKNPQVVGPHHMLPTDWLPEAKSVISLFLPFSERVIKSNTKDPRLPSMEWLYTRVDGQQHLLATGVLVRDALIKDGFKAIVPYADDKFIMRVSPEEKSLPIPTYSSNWSERHVGYITGLGTFGRMTNFITKLGTCGRLISIVTDWETQPDEKDTKAFTITAADVWPVIEPVRRRPLTKPVNPSKNAPNISIKPARILHLDTDAGNANRDFHVLREALNIK